MASEILCHYCGTANQPAESFCENCGAALHSSAVLLNQRYRILSELGKGGFGAVYRVEDTKLASRHLAVKKLQPDNDNLSFPKDYQDALQAFQREAQMLAMLKHPNLPEIYDCFEENSNSYLVMELIPGETLKDHLKKLGGGRLAIEEVLLIGIELATVLDYLHGRTPPIIFRDLKPDNIMLTPTGQIYLIDFGIARHFKPNQKKDTTNLGTHGYASPEHYNAQTTELSDIYSLGAIMHQLLSGEDPRNHPFQFPPLQLQGNPQAQLVQLVTDMLHMKAQQRPASASEVKQQFQQILQALQQPTAAPAQQQKSAIPPTSKIGAAPAQPPLIPQSAIATQLIAPRTVPPTQLIAPAPTLPPKAWGERHYSYTPTSRKTRALAWSPDGIYLAAAGEESAQVCVWSGPRDNIIRAFGHTRAINALAWSPDSQCVASASNDCTVQIREMHLGNQLGSYTQHTHWVNALAWSPDGTLLASGDANHQVHLWDAQNCQSRLTYYGHLGSILALAFAPDSQRVASADERGSVQVWDVANGKLVTTYVGHQKAVSALAWSPDGRQIVSASWDSTLHIWGASNGKQYSIYTGHQRLVKAVAWSHDNSCIASAGKDKTVQIWDPQNGNTLYTYRGHINSVNALAWSPSDGKLASAGDGAEVHVWQAM